MNKGFISIATASPLVTGNGDNPRMAIRRAAQKADIPKLVEPHTLRHSFATHLLEGGKENRTIQDLLGHKDLKTKMVYTHVANLLAVQSPLNGIRLGIKRTELVESPY